MRRILQTLSILLLLLIVTPDMASAQNTTKRKKIHVIKSDNTTSFDPNDESGIITRLKIKEDRYFNAPDAPGSMIINKRENFGITIGGAARVVMSEDFGGIVNTNNHYGFQVPLIPTSLQGMSCSQFRLDAGTSTVFIKGIAKSKVLGEVITYVSINFLGNSYSPQLRQAYIKLKGFTLGQSWSTATDLDATPPTVDYWGPSGSILMRTQLIRYENTIGKRMSYALALEMPYVGGSYAAMQNHAIAQSVPDIIGYLQYGWGKDNSSHIRVTGIMRNMSYYDELGDKRDMKTGWGAQLSGVAKLCPWATLYFSGVGGKGISRYINDIGIFNYDIMPDVNTPGEMSMTSMYGMTAGLQINLTKNLFISGTYSQSMIFDTKNVDLNGYRFSQYIVGNMFWNVTEYMVMGLEYMRGINNMFNDDKGHANRVNLSAKYSF